MRNLLTALILASCAALAACGGGDGGSDGGTGGTGGGNDGGSGGTGGVGGTGGTGGAGGTGGSGPGLCGNDKKDPGEECDDGNPFDGDGCSKTCTIEAGTCDDPRNFLFLSRPEAQGFYGHTNKIGGESNVTSCGSGTGADLTYAYEVSNNGVLQVGVLPAGRTWLSVSRTCGVDGELACVDGDMLVDMEVTKGETIYLVVDTPATSQEIEYTLLARLVPVFDEGEDCPAADADVDIYGACADELICTQVESRRICVQPNVPVLTNASAIRNGDELMVLATGVDDDRDVVGVIVSFRGDDNALIPLSGIDGAPTEVRIDFDESQVGFRSFINSSATDSEIFLENVEIRDAVTVDVTILDSRGLRSETKHVPLITE